MTSIGKFTESKGEKDMRDKPARLIGFLAAVALVLGMGGAAGSIVAAGGGGAGSYVVADDKGPAAPTP